MSRALLTLGLALTWTVWGCLSAMAAVAPRDSLKPPRKFSLLAVPTFGYAPETRAYVGAVGLGAFKLAQDSLTRSSNAKLELSYTQNRQLVLEAGTLLLTPGEKFNINLLASYRKFPEYWWGVGNTAPEGDKELYQANRIELDARVLRALGRHWFGGGLYVLRSMFGVKSPSGGLLDAVPVTGAAGGLSSGLGPVLLYDSRDHVLTPQSGQYLEVQAQAFAPWLGSEFSFTRLSLDARAYVPLREGHLLAVQGRAVVQGGEPPFRMLSLLGNGSDMRGYYQGRYRDRDYYSVQAEYRGHLFWRLGMAAFAGFGDVGRTLGDLGSADFKYSLGGGLRLLMDRKENINLRIDYAVGRQSTGFYVAFGEAF